MEIIIVSSSPNRDGLTAACVKSATEGFRKSGIDVNAVRLCDHEVGHCEQCDRGWGTCRDEHRCQILDDFQALHESVLASDAMVLITPVYYGDFSESMKAFCDRLRRCEAHRGVDSPLHGMWFMAVAAAGGGGGGAASCFLQFERLASHVGLKKFDYLGIMQRSRTYMIPAIEECAVSLAAVLSGSGQSE